MRERPCSERGGLGVHFLPYRNRFLFCKIHKGRSSQVLQQPRGQGGFGCRPCPARRFGAIFKQDEGRDGADAKGGGYFQAFIIRCRIRFDEVDTAIKIGGKLLQDRRQRGAGRTGFREEIDKNWMRGIRYGDVHLIGVDGFHGMDYLKADSSPPASGYRFFFSFVTARSMAEARGFGTDGNRFRIGMTSLLRTTSSGSRFEEKSNGNAPVSRKYIVAAKLNTSLTGLTYLKLVICSGGIKTGVPALV